MKEKLRVGILTSGGDCQALNAAMRGVVLALYEGNKNTEIIGIENGFEGYLRPDHGRNIWGEDGKPGYGLYDRALGATYLQGLWEAIVKQA